MSRTTDAGPTTISARLNAEQAAQLEFLKQMTGESTSELVKRGLSRLYEEARERRSVYELLTESGFIGSM